MGKWKDAFAKSLDPEYEKLNQFEFGPPATDAELAALSAAVSAELPADLVDLLREFNGINRLRDDEKEPYFFGTASMPTAGDMYRDWRDDTQLITELFKKVVVVCQENGFAEMWGVVVRPFATCRYGDIVSFDHDRVMFVETEADLFTINYQNLQELVEARYKDAG